MTKIKIIKCQCNNPITVKAETSPNPRSVYGFQTDVTANGNGSKIHKFTRYASTVLCSCGTEHNIKVFVDRFHAQAVKAHDTW